jgi:DNA (cytosine-5)-methyltransferase 1
MLVLDRLATQTLGGEQTDRHKNAGIPILSFFTGAGFLDLGFKQSGFDVVWHNEYSSAFVSGFEYGMASLGYSGANAKIQSSQSILDVGPREILRASFTKRGTPDCFGMIGGPPCPDFSVGGKNKGYSGDNGRLTEVYANRILEINPSFFLLENVPGLIRTAKHRSFLSSVMERLCLDYYVDLRILNALEYGVPQDRERIFLFGLSRKWLASKAIKRLPKQNVETLIANARLAHRARNESADLHWFPWEHKQLFWNPKKSYQWPDTDPFGSSPDRPHAPIELMVGPLLLGGETTAKLPNGKDCFVPYSEKFLRIPEGDVSRKSFKRLHRWRYSPAAAYGNNEVHLHPLEPRRITVREAMRIQTVPDDYSLPVKMPLSAKYKTIGNGVPVKLAEAVATTIRFVLDGIENGSFRPHS